MVSETTIASFPSPSSRPIERHKETKLIKDQLSASLLIELRKEDSFGEW